MTPNTVGRPYHKIDSIFKRDPATKHKTFLPEYTRPEFHYLADLRWVATEKVDGTNIRVWRNTDDGTATIRGRTDAAQIPVPLIEAITKLINPDDLPDEVTLYGEGYGRRIQKGGGNYIPDGVSFVLFDVLGPYRWWSRQEVDEFATRIGVRSAPIMGFQPLQWWVEAAQEKFLDTSMLHPSAPNEGFVLRPAEELRDASGHRVITKLKFKDFA